MILSYLSQRIHLRLLFYAKITILEGSCTGCTDWSDISNIIEDICMRAEIHSNTMKEEDLIDTYDRKVDKINKKNERYDEGEE